MQRLAVTALVLVLMLVSVSAYLRLDHSGIGCADWPACYGLIGEASDVEPTVSSTYARLAEEAQQPLSWATPVHRLVASVLGLVVLAMALASLKVGRDRLLSLSLLGLTVFLAWLGIYSGGLHSPAIVMGNLAGGFSMLVLTGWLVFRNARPRANASSPIRHWITAGIVLLLMQIALGGLTSANFAASACLTLPDCHGSFLPGDELGTAFDLGRSHEIGPTGLALGGQERADIHKLHRLGAVLTTIAIFAAAVLALRAGLGATALTVLALVVTEFAIGVFAVMMDLPVAVAVAHNWVAALTLLALLRLLALSRNRQDLL